MLMMQPAPDGYSDQGVPPPQYGVPPQQYGDQPQYQPAPTANDMMLGARAGMPGVQPAPVDYTTQAWIACLCCFWPTGLIAIMKASESRQALARGDFVGAQTAADRARTMVRVSWIAGILSVIVSVAIFIVNLGIAHSAVNN